MIKILMFTLIGGGLGAVMGYFGQCGSGACPLTANPVRGGLYGGVLGLLMGASTLAPNSASVVPGNGSESDAVIHLDSSEQFGAEVTESTVPVLVDFYADWCMPCRRLSPMLDDLANERTGKLTVIKVNVDQHSDLARQHGVSSIPDLRIFVAGEEVDRLVGVPSAKELQQRVDAHLNQKEIS